MYTAGTVFIALGALVLIFGVLGGLAFWIYTLALTNQWPFAIFMTGISLIIIGYILHAIFRKRK
jgi:hypothetical protein